MQTINGVMLLFMMLLWIGSGREMPMLLVFAVLFAIMWLLGFVRHD